MNHGHFLYTLDDAYIFLSAAKHHFQGISQGVIANPSSSLLGVYVLSQFQSIFGQFFPLILNTLSSLATICLVYVVLTFMENHKAKKSQTDILVKFSTLGAFIILTNQLALIFTGMEHNIQILLCVLAFYGILYEYYYKKVTHWFVLTIILLPLWRYDCLSVFCSVLFYLYLKNYIKQTVLCISVISLIYTLFFAYWHGISGSYFPNSLILKSFAMQGISQFLMEKNITTIYFVLLSFAISALIIAVLVFLNQSAKSQINKVNFLAVFLFLMLSITFYFIPKISFRAHILLFYISFFFTMLYLMSKNFNKKIVILTIITQILLEMSFTDYFAMNYFFFFRLESYWYVFIILGVYFLYTENTFYLKSSVVLFLLILNLAIFSWFKSEKYIYPKQLINASHSFYLLQYQQALFLKNYYKEPVGVEDVGIISYYSQYQFIDLCGLSNNIIIRESIQNHGSWCVYNASIAKYISEKTNINLVIIYPTNVPFQAIPDNFVLVAFLHIPIYSIIPFPAMMFYARKNHSDDVKKLLIQFSTTLPAGSTISFIK